MKKVFVISNALPEALPLGTMKNHSNKESQKENDNFPETNLNTIEDCDKASVKFK